MNILLTQIFKDESAKRNAEIMTCFSKNCENDLIDTIVLFTDECHYVPSLKQMPPNIRKKIAVIPLGKRLTFAVCVDFANMMLKGEVVIIANVDIYFDDTLRHLNSDNLQNKMLAITRYDLIPDGSTKLMNYPPNTQDVWIFTPPINIERSKIDFQLGQLGCDNRFAYEVHAAGLQIINPCNLIKCTHVHMSRKVNYNQTDTIPPPYKVDLHPTDKY